MVQGKTADVRGGAVAAVVVGTAIGAAFGIATLMGWSVGRFISATILPLFVGAIVVTVGRLLTDSAVPSFSVIRHRLALLVLCGLSAAWLVTRTLAITEPVLRYDYSTYLPHSGGDHTYFFRQLTTCGGRWFAFGRRTSPADEESNPTWVDAVIMTADTGLQWKEPDWDEANRGGIARLNSPGQPSHRQFWGGTCDADRNAVYGFGSDTHKSAAEDRDGDGTPDQDLDGAIWRLNGDRAELVNTSALGGAGEQRVVGLRVSDDENLLALAGGAEGGVKCLASSNIETWSTDGIESTLVGWSVNSLVFRDDEFVAQVERVVDSGSRESALFRSGDCDEWHRVSLPQDLRFDTSLVSTNYVDGRWYVAGRRLVADAPSDPVLAVGTSLDELHVLDMSPLTRDDFSGGLYAVASLDEQLVAIGYDYSQAREAEGDPRREDISIPLELHQQNGVSIPVLGPLRGRADPSVHVGPHPDQDSR